jgi:hypothetical protein
MPVVPMHFAELRRVVSLVGSRELQPRDCAVFWALVSHVDPMTSKVKVSAQEVGDLIGMQTPHVVASIKRLVEGSVLKRTYNEDTGVHTLHLASDIVSARERKAVVERWLAEKEGECAPEWDLGDEEGCEE